MSLLNLSEGKSGFHTALNAEEIFEPFTKHLDFFKERKQRTTRKTIVNGKEKIMRKAKRKVEKRVFPFKETLESLPKTLFSKTIERLIKGIIMSEFTFKLVNDAGTIKMHKRFDSYHALSKHKEIDALKANFSYYDLIFELAPSARNKYGDKCFITYSKELKALYKKQIESGSTFQTKNIINVYDLSKIIKEEFYPDLDLKLITKIIQHGFKVLVSSIHFDIDACFFTPSKNKNERVTEFVYFCSDLRKVRIPRKLKYIEKLRFLYEEHGKKYNGYYYACLTNEQFNTFNKKDIDVKLHLIMEETMLVPKICPHIIAVKIHKPLFRRHVINATIKYEKANTKYIWRWNDKRFKSVDNSQFVFNRRFEWDVNNL